MTAYGQALRPAVAQRGIMRLVSLVRAPGNWTIFASAGSLVGTTAVTSLLGFAYWWAAARSFHASAVGFAAAGVSAMNLLGSLAMLGFGTVVIGEIPNHRDRERAFVSTILLVSGGAGLALGVGFALVAPLISRDLSALRNGAGGVALFAAAVALTSATNVLDLALVAMLRAGVQLWRNVVFSVSKLIMVIALAVGISRSSTTGIYVTWILAIAVSPVVLVWPVVRSGARPSAFLPDLSLLGGIKGSAALHHAQNLALQLASLALPLVVIGTLSATENAYFYTSWLLAGFVFVPPFALTIGLYTIGAREPRRFTRYLRLSLGAAALFGVVSVTVTWFAAGPVLQLFGHDYRTEATWSLRLLVIGVFPLIAKDHFVACCRVRGFLTGPTVLLAVFAVDGLLAGAIGAALRGLTGLVVGWLVIEWLQMLAFAPTVWRSLAFRRTDIGRGAHWS